MFAQFDSIEAYLAKNDEINVFLGYPDGRGTERYATDNPTKTIEGKYAMPVSERIAHLFDDCEIVESVEYPEIDDEDESLNPINENDNE